MKTFIKLFEKKENEFAKKFKKKGVTITVSGLSGAGKTTFAKILSEELNLKYFSSGEIFRKMAKKRKIPLENFSEKREKEIDYKIEEETLKKAVRGSVVIEGRLSGWIAGKWADYKIFLDIPLKIRAERVAKRENLALKEALKKIKKRDKEDRKKYLKIYNIDVLDTKIYDKIIGNMPFEKLRNEIGKIIKEMHVLGIL